jgi:hypothetical protein
MNPLLVSVFLALTSPLCEKVQDLNPSGQTYDMLEWTTPSAEIRATSHMTGKHDLYTVLTTDRIWTLKQPAGDVWDVNLYDSDGIWAWITENHWGDPRSFTRWANMRQILHAPRTVHGGYPGARWVNCDSRYTPIIDCSTVEHVQGLQTVIHELHGPFTTTTGGNIGTVTYLNVVYFYDCKTTETASCASAETNWYAKPYGPIRWALYGRDEAGGWTERARSEFFDLVPGTARPFFPCDL